MSSNRLDSALAFAFRAFLADLHEVERDVRRRMARGREALDLGPPPGAEEMRSQITQLLGKRLSDALTQGTAACEETLQTTRILMASAADAALVELDWPGRRAWSKTPLAPEIAADEAVVDVLAHVDACLAAEVVDLELVQVLLLATSLELDPAADEAALAEARRRLFARLAERFPELSSEGTYLFPDAYRHQHAERGAATEAPGSGELPAAYGWLLALAAALVLLLLVSFPLWNEVTEGVRDLVEQIRLGDGARP